MRNLTKAICVTAVLAFPLPAGAQGATAFDGTYAGVTSELHGRPANCRIPTPDSVPAALTIANGMARTSALDGMEGSVNAQGVIVMHTPDRMRFDGQIDAQGNVRGQLTRMTCYISIVWQKRGR